MEVIIENFNNKLGCNSFLHIALSPKKKIDELSVNVPVTVIDKITGEKHDYMLVGFVRITESRIPQMITLTSHNLLPDELMEFLKETQNISSANELSVYIYSKSK